MSISIDSARLAKIMNEAIEQTYGADAAKGVKFAADGKNITVSYTDGAGKVHDRVPIELSPADVDIMTDPAAMEKVLRKISPEIKLDDTGVKDFLTCLRNSINDVLKNGKIPLPDGSNIDVKSLGNDMYKSLFAIMALLNDAARSMKSAAVASREAALQSEIQAIKNQAAQEKAMAWAGLAASLCVAGLQVGLGSFLKYKEIKADVKQQQMLKQNVDMNHKLMEDTMRLGGDLGDLRNCADIRGGELDSVKTRNGIAAEIGGFKINEETGNIESGSPVERLSALKNQQGLNANLDVAETKAELDQASHKLQNLEKAPVKEPDKSNPKYRFAEQEFDTKELAEEAKNKQVGELKQKVETLRGKLVETIDGKVQSIAEGLDSAEKELAKAVSDGTASSERIGELERNVSTQRNNLVYANAVRNYALSEPIGAGEGKAALIDSKAEAPRKQMAMMNYDRSFHGGGNELLNGALKLSASKWGIGSKAFDSAAQFLNALVSTLPDIIMKDKVAAQGAMTKEAESAYMSANDIVQQVNELQQKVIRLFDTAVQSNIQSGRMV